jgi:1-deoxy-D-xylulose-5-phosphate synthase
MVIATPSDENEARLLLTTCYQYPGPAAVRYPRGSGKGQAVSETLSAVEIGRGVVRREGKKLAILAFGTLLAAAESVAERLDLTLVDMRFVKPIDHALIKILAQSHQGFVTIEESSVMGGAGSAVCESLNEAGLTLPILQLGLPDVFIDHGDQASLLAGVGLDEKGIEQSIRARFKDLP